MKNYTLSIIGILSGLFILLFVASLFWLTWETADIFVTGNPVNKWPPLLFIISNIGVLVSSQLWQKRKNKIVSKQVAENIEIYRAKIREQINRKLEELKTADNPTLSDILKAGEEEEKAHTKQSFDPDGLL